MGLAAELAVWRVAELATGLAGRLKHRLVARQANALTIRRAALAQGAVPVRRAMPA
jgi:hypothetical protein